MRFSLRYSTILTLALVAFATTPARGASSQRKNVLTVSGGYAGAVRLPDDRKDFYEGITYGVRYGRSMGKNSQILFQYQQASMKANYTDIVPLIYLDKTFTLAMKYHLGQRVAFMQIGGDYLLSSGEVSDSGFGGSFGGGLNFKLTGRIAIGVTTLFAIRRLASSSSIARFMTTTGDLSFEF